MLKIKNLILKILYSFNDFFDLRGSKSRNTFKDILDIKENFFSSSNIEIGIVEEKWGLHGHYIKACNELKVSYKVINIFKPNWLEKFKNNQFNYIVVRPSVQYTPWKDMFDNRLKIINSHLNNNIYPNIDLLWLWENKLRMYEWCHANDIKHIDFNIFYDFEEVKKYSHSIDYPIVFKASSGSGSSGIKIIDNRSRLLKHSKNIFKNGYLTYRKNKLDREHGSIIIQKYIQNLNEWRIIRIGRYFFGFEKVLSGEFHSGSKEFSYGMPPKSCLDYAKEISEKHKFHFTSIDFFVKDNDIFVNEIQPYFGQENDRELLKINDVRGRLKYDENKDSWIFEAGEFCKNNLCNLRIAEINNMISK